MSSKKSKLRGIGPRLIIWTTLLSGMSLILVTGTVYYLLSSSLRKNDQLLIKSLVNEFSPSLSEDNYQALKGRRFSDYVVSVIDHNGRDIFLSLPEFLDHDFEDEEEIEQIKNSLKEMRREEGWQIILLLSGEENNDHFHRIEHWFRELAWKKNWVSILPLIDNDMVEVYTVKLSNDRWLRVGRSSEEREEHLSKIRYIILLVLTPFIFLSFIFSFVLSRSILSPVKALSQTIRDIKAGNRSTRAKVRGTFDEIDHLASEFNSLLDQNNSLIENLTESIDNVAHDLRTPITRFKSGLELALMSNDLKEIKASIGEGIEESNQVLALLNAILDISEAESGILKLNKKNIEVNQLLKKVMDLFQYVAEDKNIAFEFARSEPIHIEADEIRLTQALGNIIDNAIKYSPSNSIIHIGLKKKSHFVEISIQDEGPGIDAEFIPRVWDRLYRLDKSRSTPGLGIGLSIVKAIITAHNGQVTVHSENNKGCEFLVSLPTCNESVTPA